MTFTFSSAMAIHTAQVCPPSSEPWTAGHAHCQLNGLPKAGGVCLSPPPSLPWSLHSDCSPDLPWTEGSSIWSYITFSRSFSWVPFHSPSSSGPLSLPGTRHTAPPGHWGKGATGQQAS